MKKRIIFSGADATGKTTRVKGLVNQGYLGSILMKEIDILKYNIKENIEIAINQGLDNKNVVMDRSLIDLLAYYYINNKDGLVDNNNGIGNIHGIKKILERFIYNNEGGVFNYLIASKEVIIRRLRYRAEQGEELSNNDLKIINQEGYLEKFIFTFNNIVNILERLNEKKGNLMKINRIDTTNLVL